VTIQLSIALETSQNLFFNLPSFEFREYHFVSHTDNLVLLTNYVSKFMMIERSEVKKYLIWKRVTTMQAVLPTLWMSYVLAAFLLGQVLKFYGKFYVLYFIIRKSMKKSVYASFHRRSKSKIFKWEK
jgi:hypothetical protein